jgi:hypothetical protein
MFNVIDRTRVIPGCYELTSFGTHLFSSELERHNADEYEPYECGELEYNPEYCPY